MRNTVNGDLFDMEVHLFKQSGRAVEYDFVFFWLATDDMAKQCKPLYSADYRYADMERVRRSSHYVFSIVTRNRPELV